MPCVQELIDDAGQHTQNLQVGCRTHPFERVDQPGLDRLSEMETLLDEFEPISEVLRLPTREETYSCGLMIYTH